MPKYPKSPTYVKKAQRPMKQKGHAMFKGLGNLGKTLGNLEKTKDAYEKAWTTSRKPQDAYEKT